MKETPEQDKVLTKVKGILKAAFPAFQGSLKFHFAKDKPNADQVDCEVHYTREKQ
ncbi:hypothetical protein LCGC14_0358150 [marine sediment metagenome]|uniref:Uncharacterized protein n=1 Tax=marine sediment metagenome TaxID=412755 RepID=A0A0F9TEK6_9ZZZZ